jgi:tripartite ATP-independent transporter DctM subunit
MKVLERAISLLENIGVFSRWVNYAGAGIIFCMVGLTLSDVIARYVFNSPILGAKEVTEVMLIAAVFFTIAHTYNKKGHVSVDVVTGKLGSKSFVILDFITTVLATVTFLIVVIRLSILNQEHIAQGAFVSDAFHVISSPFSAIMVFGSIMMTLLLLRDLLIDIVKASKAGFRIYHWFLMLGVPVVLLVLAAFWMQSDLWNMSLYTVGIIGLLVFLILLLSGIPVVFALLIPAIVFIAHIRGIDPAFKIMAREIFATTGTFVWATVVFFVLMGYFCLHARFGEDLYILFNRWIGRLPGGLAMATAASCTGFAAIVGDSISSIATMTSIAMPQMKKYNYDNRLSTGCIAAGSLIGPIIPPSIPFIIYGVIAKVSIGDLFVAGIVPGLLLGVVFCVTIYIWCRFNPKMGPRGEGATWGQRVVSLRGIGPILALFILVIGGIYMGAFSPSEGGAIGASGALLIGLAMRRFTWKSFWQSLIDAAKVLSMILLIINGAILFTRFVAWCNISDLVSGYMNGLGLSYHFVVLIVLVIFFFLGFFVDVMTLTLIGVPIMHPIVVGLGADPVWFAMLVLLTLNLGALTPPVGLNLFTMKGMAPDVPIGTIYRGAIPFIGAAVLAIAIVFFIPTLATWLPNMMK